MSEVTNTDDVIDSRDVIERIAELEAIEVLELDDSEKLSEAERAELVALRKLAAEAADYAADWKYGEVLVRDSYFVEYAQQLADDIGMIDSHAGWPTCHIDWKAAAEALRQDYTAVDFDGVTYWIR